MKIYRSNFVPSIATTLDALSKDVQGGSSSDPTVRIILALAGARAAFADIEDAGIDLNFNNSVLVLPWLERAYRDTLYVRSRRMPYERLDTSYITRFGRVVREK